MRQFRTYGSVGALGGRPPRATRLMQIRDSFTRRPQGKSLGVS